MKLSNALAALVVLVASSARAGVVLTHKDQSPDGAGGTRVITSTTTISGSRSKTVNGDATVILDLDKGTIVTLDAGRKTAVEMQMSGKGPGAAMAKALVSSLSTAYRPTGAKKTVAGYACDEYRSSGKLATVEFTSASCFSKDAPGAAEYSAFYKRMFERMGAKTNASLPSGVILSQEMTTKLGAAAGADVPAEMAKVIAEAQAKRGPELSKTEVTSIKTGAVSDAEFAVPDGYTKQSMNESAVAPNGSR